MGSGDRFVVAALEPAHAAQAAELAATHVATFRAGMPIVPQRWTRPEAFADRLAQLAAGEPGVVALVDGRIVGFLVAFSWERASRRNVHSPEWANVCVGEQARYVREELYTALAERWLADGRTGHYVGLLPNDDGGRRTLGWLGFGESNIDGLRGLEPVGGGASLEITTARSADAAEVLELELGLREHLASSPLFLAQDEPPTLDQTADLLADEAQATLFARDARGALAFLRIGPASDDASTIIRDEGTASISDAFTRPDRRGQGVATALLDAALTWARERGYVRCAADYESANLLASRFWTRHFRIVGITVHRRI